MSWLFTASTYKSYLLMSRNSSTYWLRPEARWPMRERVIVDDVMRKTGEGGLDRETGVIPLLRRLSLPRGRGGR